MWYACAKCWNNPKKFAIHFTSFVISEKFSCLAPGATGGSPRFGFAYVYLLRSISRNLSTNFWINVMLKHCVSSFKIFLNIVKNDGVNFLNYNCRLISTGRKMCLSFSSFWISYFGCSSLESKSFMHSYAVSRTLLSTRPISSNITKIISSLMSIIFEFFSAFFFSNCFDTENIVLFTKIVFRNFKIDDNRPPQILISMSRSSMFSPYSSSSMNVFVLMLNV